MYKEPNGEKQSDRIILNSEDSIKFWSNIWCIRKEHNQHAEWYNFFLNCYLAVPPPALGHYWGGNLTHPMLITCVLHIWPEDHWEPRSEVGSLSLAECLVGFEPGTFRFWSQRLNPLGHSLHNLRMQTVWRNLKSAEKLWKCNAESFLTGMLLERIMCNDIGWKTLHHCTHI